MIKEMKEVREKMKAIRKRPNYRLFEKGLYERVILKLRPKDKKEPTTEWEWGSNVGNSIMLLQ